MAEPVAYGLLGLKPWELDRISPRDLDVMADSVRKMMKVEDAKRSLFTAYMVNVHLKKDHQVRVRDMMNQLWPLTAEEKRMKEIAFMREFMEEGGEADVNGVDYGADFGGHKVD